MWIQILLKYIFITSFRYIDRVRLFNHIVDYEHIFTFFLLFFVWGPQLSIHKHFFLFYTQELSGITHEGAYSTIWNVEQQKLIG